MELLGREEEILYFDREFTNPIGFASLVFGLSGVGKSYLIKHWTDSHANNDCLVSHHKCSSPTQVPQYFIKTLSCNLISSLSVEEHNLFLFSLKESIGQDFPIQKWCNESNQDYLKDGYIFIQILRALVVSLNRKIILIVDQAEKLGAESLYLLKQIVEWKPTAITIITCITSEKSGKDNFEKEFGNKFFFKGQSTFELKTISEIFKSSYFDLYGISEQMDGLHFQECALYQKRLWLSEQLNVDLEMREAFYYLAQFPDGLRSHENYFFKYFQTILENIPILHEILHIESDLIAFNDEVYSNDIIEQFSLDLQFESNNSKQKDLIRYHLFQDLHQGNSPLEDNYTKMLNCYINCLDFSNLYQLASAFESENHYSQKTQNFSKICILVSDLYFNFSLELFEEYLLISQSMDIKAQKDISPCIFHLLKVHNQKELFYKEFIKESTLPDSSNFLKQIIWSHAIESDSPNLEQFACSSNLIHSNFYTGAIRVCDYFLKGTKLQSNQELPSEYQTEAFYILGLEAMEEQKFIEAKQYFIQAVHQSLLTQEFDHLSSILSSVSEVSSELNDFESQLENYREAVIVDQFCL
ncbi:ATP-binding protein [bacterium]|nr:ATP-binding protein [bacterium]